MPEIYEIAVVRKYRVCSETEFLTIFFESLNRSSGKSRSEPLFLVFSEESESRSVDVSRVFRSVFDSARRRNVGTDEFDRNILLSKNTAF